MQPCPTASLVLTLRLVLCAKQVTKKFHQAYVNAVLFSTAWRTVIFVLYRLPVINALTPLFSSVQSIRCAIHAEHSTLSASHAQLTKSVTHVTQATLLLLWVSHHYVKLVGACSQTVHFVHHQQHVMSVITLTD